MMYDNDGNKSGNKSDKNELVVNAAISILGICILVLIALFLMNSGI